MKKLISSITILLLILPMFSAFSFAETVGSIIRVPRDYLTIQEAIDASDYGDTIIVSPGIYRECIRIVDKFMITLVGEDCKNTIINGSSYPYTPTIFIGHSKHISIVNFTILYSNSSSGVYLESSENNRIEGNVLMPTGLLKPKQGPVSGIYVYKSSNNTINRNILTNCWIGVQLNGYLPYEGGVQYVTGNKIQQNIIKNCYIGIGTGISRQNTIERNQLMNNSIALELLGGMEIIRENWIIGNGIGLKVYEGSNYIYHNNFLNNTAQVTIGACVEYWDNGYPYGGNYWSDYTGTDLYGGPFQNETGSDGIGDTPYVIDEMNEDRYPLMRPWQPRPPQEYILYVESGPIIGLSITYSGDYTGIQVTNFTIGPKASPFTVTLTAPLTYENYKFYGWLLDGINMEESNSITVEVNKNYSVRTAIAIYVLESVEPDFSISIFPEKSTISPGSFASFTVTLGSINGFSALITLEGSVTPNTNDISISFDPNIVTLSADGSSTSTLIVSTTSTISTQTYVLSVKGFGDGKIHFVRAILEITSLSIEISLVGPLNSTTVFNFTYREGKEEKVWNPHLIVRVTRNKEPVQGLTVEFYVDEEKIGYSISDANGLAVCVYEKPKVGWHTWYVIADSHRSEKWKFEFRKPSEPSFREILIDSIARFKLSTTEWASLSITKYHCKTWDSWGEQYVILRPAEIGGAKPDLTLLLNSKYILYFSLYKVTPNFGSTRTIIISIPKCFEIYDYNMKKWLSLKDVEENGPWSLNFIKSNVPPDLETPCELIVKDKLWDFIRGHLWGIYGLNNGRRVYERWGTDTVDFLQFLMDDNVMVGDQIITKWADVSMVNAAFIDEDSDYAYYAVVVDAPSALEKIYLSLPIKPVEKKSVKINMFKSPTLSDKLGQVQQIIKLIISTAEFSRALITVQDWYSIVAAIGTKGHSLYTEFTNLANLDKASHDSINIAIAESFLEAKVSCETRILLINPNGERVGFDCNEGKVFNEVPNASYSGINSYPQLVVIRDPKQGDYKVQIFAVDSGPYLFELSYYSTRGHSNFVNVTSSINQGEIQQYVVQLTAEGNVIINPYSPTKLHFYIFVTLIVAGSSFVISIILRRKRKMRS